MPPPEVQKLSEKLAAAPGARYTGLQILIAEGDHGDVFFESFEHEITYSERLRLQINTLNSPDFKEYYSGPTSWCYFGGDLDAETFKREWM